MLYGTDGQKRDYLSRIADGTDIWCTLYSEPGAGSDLAAMQTRAVRDGDSYVVNGSKIWTSFAHWANRILCLVKTDTEAKPQSGISVLLIDLDTLGVTIRPIVGIDGRHHFNEVFFTDMRVPVANRVGEENRGWSVAKSLLGFERLNASHYGESLGRLTRLKEMAAMPLPDGRRLADEDWFRRKIGEIEVSLIAVQYTALRFLSRLEAGEKIGDEVSMLKLRGSQVLQRLQALMHQTVGLEGLAFAKEDAEDEIDAIVPASVSGMAPQRFFGRGYTIAAGSSEVQHEILAKSVLGLRGLS
jgi:acyl-CoA dehydrogenase